MQAPTLLRSMPRGLTSLSSRRSHDLGLSLARVVAAPALRPHGLGLYRVPQYAAVARASTQATPPKDAYSILEKQRLRRPVAPHLTIYKPQITWYPSMLHRITGAILSGGFYIFGAAYLVAPALGWHLESASLAAWMASLSPWVKVPLKFTLAWTFTFKCLNGCRHLIWDFGKQMTNAQVAMTGWSVVGLSFAAAVGLMFA